MNKTDLKNMKSLLKYRKVIAEGAKFINGGYYTEEQLSNMDNSELKNKIDDFENDVKNKYTTQLKKLVDEMFEKYGEEDDNMIVIYGANVYERHINECERPLGDINFDGFSGKYNKLYHPICRDWDCCDYWSRKDTDPEELKYWDDKWNKYYKDIDNLKATLEKLKVPSAYDYWEDDNDALNECWYGVIGIMKDYRVVAFVIRDDGMLCDEEGYETFHNSVIKTF